MYLVIPMAGDGKRFVEAGYKFPKPLIDVAGKTMIERVVRNLDLAEARHIYVVQKEHREKFNIDGILSQFSPTKFQIIEVPKKLPGALLSVLAARDLLKVDSELVIANSDQLVVWESESTLKYFRDKEANGGIMTFTASGPKWSYALLDKQNQVHKIAEKKEISNNATIGVYYWSSSNNFLSCADNYIEIGETYQDEFYVAPVFNQAIIRGQKVIAKPTPRHISIGTPEQLNAYLESTHKN